MALYVRLQTSFFTHRKTARLRARIGDDALWLVPRFWAYAAECQPDGNFAAYLPQELSLLLGYSKDATSMLEALQQAGFMDEMQIHDWHEHNGYHDVFADRAKKAAASRWKKHNERKEKGQDKTRKDKKGKETSNASSIEGVVDDDRNRVGSWFNRRSSTPWSDKEQKSWEAIQPIDTDDILALHGYYTADLPKDQDYRRRDLSTLLNNWRGEADRARKFRPATKDERIF